MCVGVEDLEEPAQLCEMCGSVEFRYVHFMEHPKYPEMLGVGCFCAEHMEGDYVKPRSREKQLRSKSRRRQTWSNRQWRISAKGNLCLNFNGFNLTFSSIRLTGPVLGIARHTPGERDISAGPQTVRIGSRCQEGSPGCTNLGQAAFGKVGNFRWFPDHSESSSPDFTTRLIVAGCTSKTRAI
jgi:hypothetical protein